MSTWATTRTEAIEAFNGETPGAETEQALIDLYEQHPALVTAEITRVAEALAQGQIRSGWAILNMRCQQKAQPVRDTTPNAGDRDKAIARADQWLRTAGYHYPTGTETLNHLFGEKEFTAPLEYLETLEAETRGNPGRQLYGPLIQAAIKHTREHGVEQLPDSPSGILTAYDTPQLRAKMLKTWQELRHKGEAVDQAELERAHRWRDNRPTKRKPVLASAGPPPPDEPEPADYDYGQPNPPP